MSHFPPCVTKSHHPPSVQLRGTHLVPVKLVPVKTDSTEGKKKKKSDLAIPHTTQKKIDLVHLVVHHGGVDNKVTVYKKVIVSHG